MFSFLVISDFFAPDMERNTVRLLGHRGLLRMSMWWW